MISILSRKYTKSMEWLKRNVETYGLECKLQIVDGEKSFSKTLSDEMQNCKLQILVGDTVLNKTAFSKVSKLPLVYDKRSETALKNYCHRSGLDQPQQFVLDKICVSPEHFLSLSDCNFLECSCFGDFKNVRYFFIPDVLDEVKHVFSMYLHKVLCDMAKLSCVEKVKIFGLSNQYVLKTFDEHFQSGLVRTCLTDAGDSLLSVAFPQNVSSAFVRSTMNKVEELFKDNIYSKSDLSLAECLVNRLTQMHKTVGVAESLTGGLISDTIVSVAGASKVFFEGLVTYSPESKTSLLDVNPVVIDNRGVVSKEVAQSMVKGVLKDQRIDFALSATGYAGPTAEIGKPVGLCYISVGDKLSCHTYQFSFSGSRESIRQQATNSAIFMLLKNLLTAQA